MRISHLAPIPFVLATAAQTQEWTERDVIGAGILAPPNPVVADLDGDGDGNVFLTNFFVSRMENIDGGGTDFNLLDLACSGDFACDVGGDLRLGDEDDDGDLDVLVLRDSPTLWGIGINLVVYEDDGPRECWPATNVLNLGLNNAPAWFGLLDHDADGDLDVASDDKIARREPDGSYVVLSDALHGFPAGEIEQALDPMDLNGDGHPELVFEVFQGGVAHVAILEYDSCAEPPYSEVASLAVDVGGNHAFGHTLGAAGVDSDGHTDLVLVDASDANLVWFATPGVLAGTWVPAAVTTSATTGAFVVGDVDGDGGPDFVT